MVRKFPARNCRTSEKRTTQPKIPEFPEENQMERKFLGNIFRTFGFSLYLAGLSTTMSFICMAINETYSIAKAF